MPKRKRRKGLREDELRFTPRVTAKHGRTFAETWLEESIRGGTDGLGFEATEIIGWPDDATLDTALKAQARYIDLEDEIVEATFEAVQDAIAEAFVRVARRVLARERAIERERQS